MKENERQREALQRSQRLGEIADGLEEQSHHLEEEADRLQERADEQHRRADGLSLESQGIRKEQAHMREQAKTIRAEVGGRSGGGEAAGFAIGQAVRIRAEAAPSSGLPEEALSRVGLVDEREASGAYTFVRFRGIMGNILVPTGDLVAATLSEEERATIRGQKGRE